jgi:hypothetical protein
MKSIFFKSMMMVAALVCCMTSCQKDGEDGDKGDDPRDAFMGSYRIHDKVIIDGILFENDYNITITKSSVSETDIIIFNLLESGESANATVNGINFTIPLQSFDDTSGTGSGRLDNNIIRFSAQVTLQGGFTVIYEGEGPKQ